MPASSFNFMGEHFEIVVDELSDAGFTNIHTKPLGDLTTGWLKDDGEVEKIRINSSNTFSDGEWFPTDTKIVITYHSFPEKDETPTEEDPTDDDSPAETEPPAETESPATDEAPPVAQAGKTDAERSAVLEQRLKDIFGGVESMTDLLFEMPADWPGYIVGVRAEGSHAYFTLQVNRNSPDGKQLGQDAARALSTLLSKDDVNGIDWLIVEDGAGVVIDQKKPSPLY